MDLFAAAIEIRLAEQTLQKAGLDNGLMGCKWQTLHAYRIQWSKQDTTILLFGSNSYLGVGALRCVAHE